MCQRVVGGSSETKGVSDEETQGRRDRACRGWTGKQEEVLEGRPWMSPEEQAQATPRAGPCCAVRL